MTDANPADTLRAAAAKLRPSSPAVAAHTVAVRINPHAVDALAAWLESVASRVRRDGTEWVGADLHHSLAVARALLGEEATR